MIDSAFVFESVFDAAAVIGVIIYPLQNVLACEDVLNGENA